MPTQEEVVDALGNMSVMKLIELTKVLEDKWGVKAAPVAIPGALPIAPPGPTDVVPLEQTEWTVVLQSVPADKKMATIKATREITGLGLAEAKAFVEGAPKTVKEGISKEGANEIKSKLEAAGGIVEVK